MAQMGGAVMAKWATVFWEICSKNSSCDDFCKCCCDVMNIMCKSIPALPHCFLLCHRGERMRLQHLRDATTMSPRALKLMLIACHTRVNFLHVFFLPCIVYTQASGFHTCTFYSSHKIRLAIISSLLKFNLCKLLCNSSQYSCHSVAMASATNSQEFLSRLLNNITTSLNHNWKST